MKHLSIALLTFLISFTLGHAQEFDWAIHNGSFVQDEGHDITTDSNGDVLSIGTFRYTADFDPSPDNAFYLTNKAASDICVQKLNPDGELIWAVSVGGADFDIGRAICTDDQNNVYFTGNFFGIANFETDTTSEYNLTSAGIDDIFVTKLNPAGEMLWTKQIGGTGTDEAYDIALDANGNILLTGRFQNTCDFDPGAGNFDLTANTSSDDIFVCKLNSNGDFIWAKSAGTNSNDFGLGLAIDNNNAVVITGYFYGVVDFDSGNATANLTSNGAIDIFILKLDADGNYLWAKNIGSTGYDVGYALVTDGSGNIYATGRFEGTTDFDPGSGTQNFTSVGEQDIYVSKFNSSGDFVWTKTLGSSFPEWGQSIALDNTGGVYFTGFFQGTIDFDPGTSTANLVSQGYEDIYICKWDENGNYVWAWSMGGTNDIYGDRGEAITADDEGTIHTTGWFYDAADFDPGTGDTVLTSYGNYDTFVHRIEQPGNPVIESAAAHDLRIFPNPGNHHLSIENPIKLQTQRIRIFDAIGTLCYDQLLQTSSQLISIEHSLAPGNYFVEVSYKNGSAAIMKYMIQ